MDTGILEFFKSAKRDIDRYLADFADAKRKSLGEVDRMGAEAVGRLLEFASRGKMIRGGLVVMGHGLTGGDLHGEAVAVGCAMELIQSGLLVHDDIMDRDEIRRGNRSVYSMYERDARGEGIEESYHLGEAMGICVGDIAYFMAFEILSTLAASPAVCKRVVSLAASELSKVGAAQMLDMYWSASPGARSEEEVYRLYLYKTGRYTFSLPLTAGAVLGGACGETVDALETIGENMGVIFQIKDDELGLFGTEEEIGKPVGSDIKESKKTIFYSLLTERADPGQRERLAAIFGNREIGAGEIGYVRSLVIELGIRDELDRRVRTLDAETRSIIRGLREVDEGGRSLLERLLEYNSKRTA